MKKIIPNTWRVSIANHLGVTRINVNEKNIQRIAAMILQQKYPSIAEERKSKQKINEINQHEFSLYSQCGEDGILLYIFSKIGVTNRCFVEFGIGDGKTCNSANLSLNFNWRGLLIECDEKNVTKARQYYKMMLEREGYRIKIVQSMVTKDNINKIIQESGIQGQIDLLSVDIDGNDYWLWQAITGINPRVVVIEYNASLGSDKSITVKYDPQFDRHKIHPTGFYHGASLVALTKLAHAKGYVLVGCDSAGIDAFFVRKDVAKGKIVEMSIQQAYFPHILREDKESTAKQFEHIKHLEFVEI